MPKELEQRLKRSGRKKGFIGERLDKYIFGTMRKLGWKPKREKKSKYQRSK